MRASDRLACPKGWLGYCAYLEGGDEIFRARVFAEPAPFAALRAGLQRTDYHPHHGKMESHRRLEALIWRKRLSQRPAEDALCGTMDAHRPFKDVQRGRMDGDWPSEDAHRPPKDAHDALKDSHGTWKDTHRASKDAHWPSESGDQPSLNS